MPALLSVEEASTMYHEFGHALDALFNKSTYNQTNVAWDFVELAIAADGTLGNRT